MFKGVFGIKRGKGMERGWIRKGKGNTKSYLLIVVWYKKIKI